MSLCLVAAAPGSAQQAASALVDSLAAGPVLEQEEVARSPARPSPGGAFLRSVLLPGWGQAASGAYSRAVFYVLMESSTAYMLVKTRATLSDARDRVAFREDVAMRRAAEAGVTDPDSLLAFLEEDEELGDALALEEGRSQQQEDWLAFGLFMLLLSGADAFVSAHLSDFPEALTVQAGAAADGSPVAEIKVGLPWAPGGFRPRH